MNCPQCKEPVSVFLARRAYVHRAYTGCRECGESDWVGGLPAIDEACADALAFD